MRRQQAINAQAALASYGSVLPVAFDTGRLVTLLRTALCALNAPDRDGSRLCIRARGKRIGIEIEISVSHSPF